MPPPDIPLDLNLLPEQKGVYIVGGTTRDLLLGLRPVDYDIVVSQNPEIFAEKTAARSGGRLVRMGRPGKMSFRVIAGRTIMDITGLNGPTVLLDLDCRDLTINAMAIELATGRLVDPTGGRRDLAENRIRMVSDKSFRQDPIRLLRAFRLAAVFGFSIESRTLSAVSRDADLIRSSAGERIRSELHALFSCRKSYPNISIMAGSGLLEAVFPELAPLRRIPAHTDPESTLLAHTLSAYRQLETLLCRLPPGIPPKDKNDATALDHPNQAAWLKCALLLHHTGATPTPASPPSDDRLPDGHGTSGPAIVETACRRLRLSANEQHLVTGIVRHHREPFRLFERFSKKLLNPEDVTRFFMKCDRQTPHVVLHALADAKSLPPGRHDDPEAFTGFAQHILRTYLKRY